MCINTNKGTNTNNILIQLLSLLLLLLLLVLLVLLALLVLIQLIQLCKIHNMDWFGTISVARDITRSMYSRNTLAEHTV